MSGAYAAIGAAFVAIAITFLSPARKAKGEGAGGNGRFVGYTFLGAGLLFFVAALITIFND